MAKKKETLEDAVLQDVVPVSKHPLLDALRENDKRNLFRTNVNTAFLKTGFPVLDYYLGSVINVHDAQGIIIRQDARVGQAAGTFNMVVGTSGSGKTTLCSQIAANIARQYAYSNIVHYDCEDRFDLSRCETITQLPAYYFYGEDGMPERYLIKTGMIGLDTIQEMVVKTYVTKKRLKDQLMIPSGDKDEFGKDVMIYQPTIMLIDSITTVLSTTFSADNTKEANDAEKMRANTEGARDAKTLKGFFKDIIPLCKEVNIIIYGINHLNSNMSMNSFTPVQKQQNYLKQDESIPGGRTMIFYPFNILKLIARPSDDFREESDGFAGHVVMVEPIKCSSNQSGNDSKGISFEMIFAFKHGFDSLRSSIHYARQHGIIEGNKTRLKFRDDPSFTFTWKDIYKEKEEKPIWENVKKYVIPELNQHLSYVEPQEITYDNRALDY